MTPSNELDRLTKAARLMILLELQERGALEGLTLQAIANLFPAPPNRSTILRDLRRLDELKIIRDEMRKYADHKTTVRKHEIETAAHSRPAQREPSNRHGHDS